MISENNFKPVLNAPSARHYSTCSNHLKMPNIQAQENEVLHHLWRKS